MQEQTVNCIALWAALNIVLVSGFFPTISKIIFKLKTTKKSGYEIGKITRETGYKKLFVFQIHMEEHEKWDKEKKR